jgi:hypothetical protein
MTELSTQLAEWFPDSPVTDTLRAFKGEIRATIESSGRSGSVRYKTFGHLLHELAATRQRLSSVKQK